MLDDVDLLTATDIDELVLDDVIADRLDEYEYKVIYPELVAVMLDDDEVETDELENMDDEMLDDIGLHDVPLQHIEVEVVLDDIDVGMVELDVNEYLWLDTQLLVDII